MAPGKSKVGLLKSLSRILFLLSSSLQSHTRYKARVQVLYYLHLISFCTHCIVETQIEMDFPTRCRNKRFLPFHEAIETRLQHSNRESTLAYILEELPEVYPIEYRNIDGLTPMLLAAKLGQDKVVKQLIKHCANLHAEDNERFTALHWAVERDHERVAHRLLHYKADINHVAADNLNPLQRAAGDGAPQHANLPMVRLLLRYGANPNQIYDYSKRLTLLHQAVNKNNKELVTLLLEHGAETSARDITGRTAVEYDEDGGMVDLLIEHSLSERYACGRDLIRAAKFFKVDLVRRLIESGVDVNSRDSRGQTALLITQESADDGYDGDDAEVLDLLLKADANPYASDYDLRTPISSINISNSSIACLYDEYRGISSRNGPTRLHQAVAEGDLNKIEDLLDSKVHRSHINKQDEQGFTALHYAILWMHHNKEDIVQRLIDAEADINVPDMYSCTSLHYAVATCSESLTKLILDAGGDPGAMNTYGRTPAEVALSRKMPDLHKMLMRYTAPL